MTDPATTEPSVESADAPTEVEPRRLGLVATVGVVVLVLDQATKSWAVSELGDGRVIDLIGSLRFNLLHNTGVAFSQGSGKGLGPWISILAFVVVIAVSLGATSRFTLGAIASGLISGGAVGNLVDRAVRGPAPGDLDRGFLHGAVIDFIDLQWWPVFNIADAGVVVGALLLVLASLRVSLVSSDVGDGASDERVTVEVPTALDGERIDRVVAMVTDVSRTEAARLVADGRVSVGGVVATRGADRLAAGAEISIEVQAIAVAEGPSGEAGVEVPVVHEDDAVVVVDKPADLVVHPGAGNEDGTLVNGLLARYPESAGVGDPTRPGIVHRLDRGTSGLLVVARTQAAYEDLVEQLSSRTVERQYRTLVWGHLESPRGVVDAPIGRSPKHPTRMAVTEKGKPARTRYEVEAAYLEPVMVSELACQLETGRTHQIRVHLAAIGHSVVGDDRYRGVRQSLDCPRPFLHAERLGFDHPTSGERLTFESPLPADLAQVRATLR